MYVLCDCYFNQHADHHSGTFDDRRLSSAIVFPQSFFQTPVLGTRRPVHVRTFLQVSLFSTDPHRNFNSILKLAEETQEGS